MSASRLSNIEKRLEHVADRFKSFGREDRGFIAGRLPVILGSARRALPISVAIWSILELPIELILARSTVEGFAATVGRLIWIALALATTFKLRFSQAIFLFLCAVSSIVVIQTLPIVYKSSPLVFGVLVVDLLLKVLTLAISLLLALVVPHPR